MTHAFIPEPKDFFPACAICGNTPAHSEHHAPVPPEGGGMSEGVPVAIETYVVGEQPWQVVVLRRSDGWYIKKAEKAGTEPFAVPLVPFDEGTTDGATRALAAACRLACLYRDHYDAIERKRDADRAIEAWTP